MNWLKKGPELKLPEVKVPDFLFDLYYDLKERRLLPLVGLLLLAIVAVPLLVGGSASSDSGTEAEEEAAIATPSSSGVEASALVVARSAPGLRDYRQRLRHASAIDPFRQPQSGKSAEAASAGGEESVTVSGGSETSVPAEASVPESASTLPSPVPAESVPVEAGTGGGESGNAGGPARYASNTVDVRIVTVPGGNEDAAASAKPKPQVQRGLPELTMLPSRKVPAAVFMGTTSDGKKALLLVSSDVESIFGDGQCVVGSKTCQLLALEPGLPETFVYGPQGRTYRIEILKITKKVSAKPNRAPLGATKKKSQPKSGKQPDGKPETGTAGQPQP